MVWTQSKRNGDEKCCNKKKSKKNSLHLLCSLGGTFNCTFLYITYLMNIYRVVVVTTKQKRKDCNRIWEWKSTISTIVASIEYILSSEIALNHKITPHCFVRSRLYIAGGHTIRVPWFPAPPSSCIIKIGIISCLDNNDSFCLRNPTILMLVSFLILRVLIFLSPRPFSCKLSRENGSFAKFSERNNCILCIHLVIVCRFWCSYLSSWTWLTVAERIAHSLHYI